MHFPFKHVGYVRESIVALILLLNTFSWYYLIENMLVKMGYGFGQSLESNILWSNFLISTIISIIFGTFFSTKIRKIRFLRFWTIFGVLASISSMILIVSPLTISFFVVCLLGISLGVGFPACFSYFTETTPIEYRGKIGGMAFFITFLITPFLFICISILDVILSVIFIALWRMWCLLGLFLISEREKVELVSKKSVSFFSVLRNRTFYLYFLSWLIFASMDAFGAIVVKTATSDLHLYIKIIEPVVAGISAIIAGNLSDRIGRKRIVIIGFASFGITYAVLGLTPHIWISWVFHFIITGIVVGSLGTIFAIVLWGDMAADGSEKFYALGEIPFFLSRIFSLIFTPYLALIPQSNVFSLAAFFLFIAVIPLLYAPETLPEKKIREIELRLYVEKAKKIKQRYAK